MNIFVQNRREKSLFCIWYRTENLQVHIPVQMLLHLRTNSAFDMMYVLILIQLKRLDAPDYLTRVRWKTNEDSTAPLFSVRPLHCSRKKQKRSLGRPLFCSKKKNLYFSLPWQAHKTFMAHDNKDHSTAFRQLLCISRPTLHTSKSEVSRLWPFLGVDAVGQG